MLKFLKNFWNEIKLDPYFHIANVMRIEGYSDYEIDMEIASMKAAEAEHLNDDPHE